MKIADVKLQPQEYKIISKVRFGLDPSFGVEYMDVKAGNGDGIEFKATGFGEFNVPMTIFFHRSTGIKPLTVDYKLCFDKNITKKNL